MFKKSSLPLNIYNYTTFIIKQYIHIYLSSINYLKLYIIKYVGCVRGFFVFVLYVCINIKLIMIIKKSIVLEC